MRKTVRRISKHCLWLLTILYPFLVTAQQPTRTMEKASRAEINDDGTYSAKLDHPAFVGAGPVVLLDEAHGNLHFDKAFVTLVSADGYRVLVSREPLKYEELRTVKILVIMNPGVFMPLTWRQNPRPLFTDVEAAAVKDWIAAGGSLLFASGTREAETDEMLMSHLGVTFSQDLLLDRELLPPKGVEQPQAPQRLTFTREKQMIASHSIMEGHAESERVNTIALDHASPIVKVPDNAIVLLHCSETALIVPRDWLLKKQEAEAEGELLKGKTESQPVTMQSLSAPAPKVAVAVAFTLGKGRVVVIGNSPLLSSVVRQTVFLGNPVSQKVGLGDGDNQKFTLNIMHWLSGLLD